MPACAPLRSNQPCYVLCPHLSSPLPVTLMQAQLLASPSWSAACAVYQPTAAAAATRPYASSALESLQEAAAKIRKAAASSAEAVKSAGSSISHAPDAVYNALPKPAQQLVNAAQVRVWLCEPWQAWVQLAANLQCKLSMLPLWTLLGLHTPLPTNPSRCRCQAR